MNLTSRKLSKIFIKASKLTHLRSAAFTTNFYDIPFGTNLEFVDEHKKFEAFRVMDEDGKIINKKYENIEKDKLLRIFQAMVTNCEADKIFNQAQRQSRISFYMTSMGEEACTVGAAAGVEDHDLMYPQYREQGSLIYRGFTIKQMADQLKGNHYDVGKGKQMPIHYGSKELHYVTVSSPLGTQIPQASGSGYKFRIKNEDRIALTFFGDGSTSEGDFHSAMNFAATLRSQTMFFCRNNMFAISTPVHEQFAGDGVAARGVSYGMSTIRVDGNDIFAVYNAVKEARKIIVKEKRPVLIEAITYRGGDHSTSDYSKLYRNDFEMAKVEALLKKIGDPITRVKNYLENKKWIDKDYIDKVRVKLVAEIRDALKASSLEPFPPINEMFNDVYKDIPQHLKEQKEELNAHLEKYGEHYKLDQYMK
jgi:2-oxoisovalerate dehydrogenase E1 component alpha subunit